MAATIHKYPVKNNTPINSTWYQPEDNELGPLNTTYAITNGGEHSLSFRNWQKMSRLKVISPTKSWLRLASNSGFSLGKPEQNDSNILVVISTVAKKSRTVGERCFTNTRQKRKQITGANISLPIPR